MNRHLSAQEISDWMLGEHAAAVETHARECPQCAAELESMQEALALFRDSGRRWSEHWHSQGRPAGRRRHLHFLRLAGALATCCIAALLLVRAPAPAPPPPPQEPFVRIPYTAPPAPYECARIVRMDIPVAALIAAGFHVRAVDMAAAVRADVLFGQDGRALAIRPVPRSEFTD